MEPGSFSYADQFGIGAAGPTHEICCAPDASPVLSSAEEMRPTLGLF